MNRVAVVVLVGALGGAAAARAARPPGQPESGPGGADYAHKAVTSRVCGAGVERYWIFEPADPVPGSAPVVVFNHGWMAMQPMMYLGWIHHLVRKGRIVVYPRYQDGMLTKPWTFAANAIGAVQAALRTLENPGHVRPDLERFALVGHSAGGAIAADMAALAAEKALPEPKAVMVVQPGRGVRRADTPFFPSADYGRIPAETLLLVVVGDDDRVVGDVAAKDLFGRTPQIPADRKDYITVHTDRHGSPPLVADHISPCSPFRPNPIITGRRIDALDYYAYWKLLDALLDAAFHGKNRDHALGHTPEQRFMGRWSNGRPVKELTVTDEP